MGSYNLLICQVPHNKAETISDAAVKAGSFGGTVLMGRSISPSGIAALFGIGENTVELVLILTEAEFSAKITTAIVEVCQNERKPFTGFLYSINANKMLKTGKITGGDESMSENSGRELITVILNKGYADDAMAAARKAGAGGGTVVNARGTAREDDAKFFGMHIVPEKEMLMIVVEADKKQAVLESIQNLPCLSEPGSGIAFCSSVENFEILGKK